MKVLFLIRMWPDYGGVSTVTRCLANEFVKRGHEVHVAFFECSVYDTKVLVDKRVILHYLENVKCDEKISWDVEDCYGVDDELCKIINLYKIEFVINNTILTRPYIKAIKLNTSAKVIYCLHQLLIPPYEKPRTIVRWVKHSLFPKHYIRKHNSEAAKKVNEVLPFVDKYVFLSRRYADQYCSITESDKGKIGYIPNPVSYSNSIIDLQFDDKENVVLVVGRMVEYQKRFSLVLKMWAAIEASKKEGLGSWKLVFVGDGESLSEYRELANGNGLKRVEFVGYQSPVPYYQRAKIFLMTSKFEGLPMVILEAQQMGVVPVVMDSFPALHDIVTNRVNGFIVPNNSVFKMSKQVESLMLDENRRKEMALKGLESVKKFSVENIADRWEQLFCEL